MSDQEQAAQKLSDLQETFARLQRRDWELWVGALILTSLFGIGMVLSFYSESYVAELVLPYAKRLVGLELGGLFFLLVLLNVYLIHRKRFLNRLWQRSMSDVLELLQSKEEGARDPLTLVYSRRFFDEAVPREANRCDRLNEPMSIVLMDVDQFRELNRSRGHLVGDQVLKAMGGLLLRAVRNSDMVFRFGGDEFLLVLPGTPLEGAAVVEQRITERLPNHQDIKAVGWPITVSMADGVYQRGKTLEAVLDQIEEGLYARRPQSPSKAAGASV